VALAPISGELPEGPFDLERSSACTAKVCRLDDFVPDHAFLRTTREGVPAEGAVWLETIADQSTVELPPAERLDAIALVLEGNVAYGQGQAEKGESAKVLGPWEALQAAGSGVFLRAQGGRASVLMAVTARGGSLEAGISAAKQGKGKRRPAPGKLETVNFAELTRHSWAKGAYHARVAFGGGDPAAPPAPASLTILQASGNGAIPNNTHADEWEHVAVLRGSGEVLLGNAKYRVRQGSLFNLPRGVVHGFQGSGDELTAVLIFSPGGPEQRFVELGAGK
jgi:mannose-6-phosphate isomerase-like protein (cupin superfamily)